MKRLPALSHRRRRIGALLILLTVATVAAPVAMAQGRPRQPLLTPEQRVEWVMTTLTDQLTLSSAQADSLRPVVVAHIEKQTALRDQYASQSRPAARGGSRKKPRREPGGTD